MTAENCELLTAQAVAQRLGIIPWRVYVEAKAGRLPGVVWIGRRTLRFDPEAIERFVAAGGTRPNGEGAR
jgi:hypothetical protein